MRRLTIADLLRFCDALGISLGTSDAGALRIDCNDIQPHQCAWLKTNDVTLVTSLAYGTRLARVSGSQARHRPHTGTPPRALCKMLMRVLEMPACAPPVQRRHRFDRDPLTAPDTDTEDRSWA